MAINVSFNGSSIFKPGSYSKSTIDLGGGFPLGAAGLVAVFGEADAGAPGSQEVDISQNRFTADQVTTIVNEYRSGPIADVASFLFSPAADAAIPSGAQVVWFYKTNNSTRASLALPSSYGTVQALEYGIGGNRVSQIVTALAETPPSAFSSPAFNESLIAVGNTFGLRLNGGPLNTFTFATAPTSTATLATILATAGNWSLGLPAGINIVVSGSTGASIVTMTMAAAPTQFELGWGRSFELVTGSPDALVKMNLSAGLIVAPVEPSVTIILNQKRDNLQETAILGGNPVITIGRNTSGGVTSASVTVDANNIILLENAVPVFTIPKASYSTLLSLVNDINVTTYPGWSAAVTNSVYNNLSLSALDQVVTVGALASGAGLMPARIKKDASEVADMFSASSIADLLNGAVVGLPAAILETLLTGGTRGATAPSDIVAALAKFEKFHVNSVLPLFSRDATADIADGLTDPTSTYTLAGIHQAVKTYISLMKTTKRRSECQGYMSMKDTYVNCKTQAGVIADAREQLMIQDIRQTDAQGNIKWFQPWALAALLAGSRGGAPIGEPLTFKFMNCAGIRQTGQAMSTSDANIVIDFDPDLQTDDAILAGLTFLEAPQTGGFRVVVDNTTYGIDENWVFNRANVLYAADIVAYNFRNAMESVFIGRKNTVSVKDVAGVASSTLNTFLGQGITVSTSDAPQGFKNLIVSIVGDVINIEVTIKLVEGIDFILSSINIQRVTA